MFIVSRRTNPPSLAHLAELHNFIPQQYCVVHAYTVKGSIWACTVKEKLYRLPIYLVQVLQCMCRDWGSSLCRDHHRFNQKVPSYAMFPPP